MVFANSTGTDPEIEELLAGLKSSSFSQGIVQEDTNVYLENFKILSNSA